MKKTNNHIYSLLVIAIFITLICPGCSRTWRPVSSDSVIYQALTVGEHYPVRIAIEPSLKGDGYQRQTQAFVDGQWQWLSQSYVIVGVGERDWWFKPVKYVSVKEALKWFKIKDENLLNTVPGVK